MFPLLRLKTISVAQDKKPVGNVLVYIETMILASVFLPANVPDSFHALLGIFLAKVLVVGATESSLQPMKPRS